MALSVIGAGFGRTGTDSMREALNILGFGPCHHMHEVHNNPGQLQLWRALAQGARPDWPKVFDGFRSAIDWPSAYYWRELAEFYPNAKVLLTTRSAESWLASMEKTIFAAIRADPKPESLGTALIDKGTFGGRIDDPDHVLEVFNRHHDEVRASIPPDRLLTYHIGDGWEPLCAFLKVDVPGRPFPSRNTAAEFNESMKADQTP